MPIFPNVSIKTATQCHTFQFENDDDEHNAHNYGDCSYNDRDNWQQIGCKHPQMKFSSFIRSDYLAKSDINMSQVMPMAVSDG